MGKEGEEKIKERLWVVVKGARQTIAVGVVYMGVNTRLYRAWNNNSWEKLDVEVGALHSQGFKLVLAGDFNGHIGNGRDEWEWEEIAKNG